jgi:hypothetical protein
LLERKERVMKVRVGAQKGKRLEHREEREEVGTPRGKKGG